MKPEMRSLLCGLNLASTMLSQYSYEPAEQCQIAEIISSFIEKLDPEVRQLILDDFRPPKTAAKATAPAQVGAMTPSEP